MHRPSPVRRVAAAVLIAGLIAAAPGMAAEQAAEAQETAPAPSAGRTHWYDTALHNTNVGVDLMVVRPLAAFTLGAGAVLFVPAAIMTAPNGWESVKEAYQRFVAEPTDYLVSRPLGEF